MREKIKKFSKSGRIFLLTQKGIERFNESCFKSRKVKRRATSSKNRKFFIVVVKSDDKMKTILNDTTKFLDLGPVTKKDNTAKIESRIQ